MDSPLNLRPTGGASDRLLNLRPTEGAIGTGPGSQTHCRPKIHMPVPVAPPVVLRSRGLFL